MYCNVICVSSGGASLDLNVVQPKPSKWIMDTSWLNLVELSNLHQFSGILEQVARNEKAWRAWFDKEAPEDEIIPDGYNNSLDVFRRLLLVRCWAPDRTLAQARKYIADSLGKLPSSPLTRGSTVQLRLWNTAAPCFKPLF